MGAGLEGVFASLVGSTITSGFNAIMQNETNRINADLSNKQLDTSVAEAQKNRDFQDQQRIAQNEWQDEQYNKYSSPVALVNNMRSAGVNPAAVLSGGTSAFQPFSGSGGSSGQGSSITLPSVGHAVAPQFANVLGSVGNFMESLANTKKLGVETSRLEQMIPKEIEGLLLDNQGKELLNAQKQLDLDINRYCKDDKVRYFYYQWRNMMFDTFVKGADADLKHVQAVTEVSKNRLNEALADLHGSEKEKLALDISHYEQQFNTYMDNLRAKSEESRASARRSDSESELARLQGEQVESYTKILNNPWYRRSLVDQLTESVRGLRKANKISDKSLELLEQNIIKLQKANSTYEIQLYTHLINETLGTVGDLVGEFSRFGLAKKFLSNEDKIEKLQGEFDTYKKKVEFDSYKFYP